MTTSHALERRRSKLLMNVQRRSAATAALQVARSNAQKMYCSSADAKACHLSRMDGSPKLVPDGLLVEARRLNVFEPFKGSVPYYHQYRGSKAPRPICSFPRPLKVADRMAKDLIEAQFEPGRHYYNWKGRGSQMLIRSLRDALATRGSFLIIADVRDCYPSINPDVLYELEILPNELVEAALDVRRHSFVRVDPEQLVGGGAKRQSVQRRQYWHGSPEQVAPRGLMQGLASSNAILAVLLNDIVEALPDNITLFVWSDNIAIVCSTENECSHANDALARYFSEHRAGPLSHTVSFFGHIKEQPEFLGYRMALNDDCEPTITFSYANYFKSIRRVLRAQQVREIESVDEALRHLTSGLPALDPNVLDEVCDLISEHLWLADPGDI